MSLRRCWDRHFYCRQQLSGGEFLATWPTSTGWTEQDGFWGKPLTGGDGGPVTRVFRPAPLRSGGMASVWLSVWGSTPFIPCFLQTPRLIFWSWLLGTTYRLSGRRCWMPCAIQWPRLPRPPVLSGP